MQRNLLFPRATSIWIWKGNKRIKWQRIASHLLKCNIKSLIFEIMPWKFCEKKTCPSLLVALNCGKIMFLKTFIASILKFYRWQEWAIAEAVCWRFFILFTDLVCEPAYFSSINTEAFMRRHMNCVNKDKKASYVAPGVNLQGNVCTVQDEKLMYSCTSRSRTFARLCPCRDYIKGQIALCKGCL